MTDVQRPAEISTPTLFNLITLVKNELPRGLSITEVDTWDQPTKRAVSDWCSAVYLVASDNDDVVIPPIPEILRPYNEWGKCRTCWSPFNLCEGIHD